MIRQPAALEEALLSTRGFSKHTFSQTDELISDSVKSTSARREPHPSLSPLRGGGGGACSGGGNVGPDGLTGGHVAAGVYPAVRSPRLSPSEGFEGQLGSRSMTPRGRSLLLLCSSHVRSFCREEKLVWNHAAGANTNKQRAVLFFKEERTREENTQAFWRAAGRQQDRSQDFYTFPRWIIAG